MMVLFISDLHLCSEHPLSTRLFLEFLAGQGRQARALYILGDLFESWVGDDVLSDPQAGAPYAAITAAIQGLSDHGTAVFLMHGNRDFLLATTFCRATGATLLTDPTVITLDSQRVLLTHGDLLCSDDVAYQRLRVQMRDPQWQRDFLTLPLAQRLEIARQYRAESVAHTSAKSEAIMDVNQATVVQFMHDHAASMLVHGHTHRPGTHTFQHRGVLHQRLVLGAWYEQGSVLVYNDGNFQLETFS